MRKKFISIITLVTLSLSLMTGCDKANNNTTDKATTEQTSKIEASSDSTIETTDNDNSESEAAQDETTSPANTETSSESNGDVAFPAGSESLFNISVHSLILCTQDLDTSYNPDDATNFWNATAYAIVGYGSAFSKQTDSEGKILFTTEQVKEFAASIWGQYDLSADLPAIPDTISAYSYNSNTGMYSFPGADFNSTKVVAYDCTDNNDSTYTVKVKLMINDEDNIEISNWSVTIAPSTYTGSSSPIFKYKITNFSPIA